MTKLIAPMLLLFSINAHAYFECLDNVSGESAQWAVGQHNHPVIPGYQLGNGTAACFVDGPELAYIKQNFSGLPLHNGPVMIWTGESADFLLGNL